MNAAGMRSKRDGSISGGWRVWSAVAHFTSLMLVASTAAAAQVPACEKARPGHVVVYGDVEEERVFSPADLLALPRTTVQARFHDGPLLTFEGVTLRELLVRSGVAADLRSADLTRYVVVEAADGYRALFSLPELDPAFREQVPVLADRENGHAIESRFGPFQVIQPAESQHARSVRQVVCLRLGRDIAGDQPTIPAHLLRMDARHMGLFDKLMHRKEAAPPPQQADHAVIVHFEYGSTDLSRLFTLEGQLEEAIAAANAGEFDGNEIAADGSDGTLYMYGPDADALFAAVRPALEAPDFMRGARVRLRYGPPHDGVREVELVLPT